MAIEFLSFATFLKFGLVLEKTKKNAGQMHLGPNPLIYDSIVTQNLCIASLVSITMSGETHSVVKLFSAISSGYKV